MKKLAMLSSLLILSSALAVAPKDTLVYQWSNDIPTLDPGAGYDAASNSIIENLYETLLTYKGASIKDLEPQLATKWTVINAGKTVTFDLRKNVKFHSGNTMTCADAEYSFERLLVTNEGGSANYILAESLLGGGANANDDKTLTWARIDKAVECNATGQLVFTLPKVDPTFLARLAFIGFSVVDSKYAIGLGEWSGKEADWKAWVAKDLTGSKLDKAPSGTGAYKFVREDATALLATAFDGYWSKQPAIKNIILQRVDEPAARQQAFLRGDADIIEGSGRATDTAQLKGKPGVAWVDDLPNLLAGAVFMNQNITDRGTLGSGKLDGKGIPSNFFKDVNVRRAFSYAFNYPQYIQDVQRGSGKQRTTLMPETFPGYDAKVKKYTYNRAQATAYFKRAWGGQVWKNGFVLTAAYRDGSAPAQAIMEILKREIEAINPKFKVNIAPKQWSEIVASGNESKNPMISIAWAPDFADPDNFMYVFYSSNGYYATRSGWKDASVDKWLEQTRTTTNTAERNRLYSLVANRAYEQASHILTPAGINYSFYRDNLVGAEKANYNPMLSFDTGTYWKDLSKK